MTMNHDASFNSSDDIVSFNSQHAYQKSDSSERFKLMYNALVSIGFPPRHINNCFRIFACQNISEFIEKLIKSDDKYSHPFIKNNALAMEKCEVCEEGKECHEKENRYTDEEILLNRNISSEEFQFKKTHTIKFLAKLREKEDTQTFKAQTLKKKVSDEKPYNEYDTLKKQKGEACVNVEIANKPDQDVSIDTSAYGDEMSTCLICECRVFIPSLPVIYHLKCNHTFCMECLDFYIEVKILDGDVIKINCPSSDCNQVFNQSDVLDLILYPIESLDENNETDRALIKGKQELADKYKKFLKNLEVERDDKKFFCPWIDCEGYGCLGNAEVINQNSIVRCNLNPAHEFCAKCGSKRHVGDCLTEQEIEIRRKVAEGILKLKKCPKCKNWTEKHGGCNHMTCIHCKYEWCWICNNATSSSHFNVPNTRCYGRQFPVEGRDDYVKFDEDDFNRAVEALNPGNPNIQNIPNIPNVALPVNNNYVNYNQGAINNVDPLNNRHLEWYDQTTDIKQFISAQFIRYHLFSYANVSDNCDRTFILVFEIFYIAFVALFSAFGNLFFLILLWKNDKILFDDIKIHESPSCAIKLSLIMYHFAMYLLWAVYYVQLLGFTSVMVIFYIFNSVISICRRPSIIT